MLSYYNLNTCDETSYYVVISVICQTEVFFNLCNRMYLILTPLCFEVLGRDNYHWCQSSELCGLQKVYCLSLLLWPSKSALYLILRLKNSPSK